MPEGVNHELDPDDDDLPQLVDEDLSDELRQWLAEGRAAAKATEERLARRLADEAAQRLQRSHEGEDELEARRRLPAARLAKHVDDILDKVRRGRMDPGSARWLLDVMHSRLARERWRALRDIEGIDDTHSIDQIKRSRLAAGKAISASERARRRAMHWFERAGSELLRLGGGDLTWAHLSRVADLLALDITAKGARRPPSGNRGEG